MNLARRITIIWMMAVTVHLPFPVCDGDSLGSGERPVRAAAEQILALDIDMILLGCDLPEDVDDGPLDNGPADGSHSSFGAYFTSRGRPCEADSLFNPHRSHADLAGEAGPHFWARTAGETGFVLMPRQDLSGIAGQSGPAVMRC